jgi:hypothetical protein
MQKPDIKLGDRGYKPEHIRLVLSEINAHFPDYFCSFCPSAKDAKQAFEAAIGNWERDRAAYVQLFHLGTLEEYEDDPNSFKSDLRTRCPIIRRCLNSSAKEMKKYKISFNSSTGRELLDVTRNIVVFGNEYVNHFNNKKHEAATAVKELQLGELLSEDYSVYGVIGGGIKSHFLYSLHPQAFSNRSQNAIWALYFLTEKKDFGFSDGSEFLMVDANEERSTAQQNYHYPYDLFAYYALCLHKMLKEACAKKGIALDNSKRYCYVDGFVDHIAARHGSEINCLKGTGEYGFEG